MHWLSRKTAIPLLKGADVVGAAVAFILAMTAAPLQSGVLSSHGGAGAVVFIYFPAFLVINAVLFSLFGLYTDKALFFPAMAAKGVVKAVTGAAMVLLLGAWLFDFPLIDPLFLLAYWFAAVGIGLGFRRLVRSGLLLGNGGNAKRTLIVGTGRRAMELAGRMYGRPERGRRLIGFVDDAWREGPANGRPGFERVADFAGFKAFLRDNVVDEVIISLPLQSLFETASLIVAECEEQGVSVTVSARLFDLKNPRMRPHQYGGEIMQTVYSSSLDEREMLLKRGMDVVGAALCILVLSPLLAVVWLLIRFTMGAPVVFSQERVGLHKRRFTFYKFRTMERNAEARQDDLECLNETCGATFKIKNDPRVTRLGRFLRKSSIDELPQLFNVLRGDMGLVGPRPLPVRDVKRIEKDWPRRRFSVKPGITCIWQVSGRNNVPFERMMEMDIEYVDTWSPALDLKLLLKTIPVVLGCRGAY